MTTSTFQNTDNPYIHNYDIVEGPVADDDIANRVKDYLLGIISKEKFLSELKFRKNTHQICFCTHRSLQALKLYDEKTKKLISNIGTQVIKQLMLDKHIDESKATDVYFNSDTFAQLEDESTELYQRPWQEIYEILKKGINNKN